MFSSVDILAIAKIYHKQELVAMQRYFCIFSKLNMIEVTKT